MYVRGGPGTDHVIVSTVAEGQQYAAVSTNAAGDWWQIEYVGKLAWVYGGFVTPSTDAERTLQADPAGWLTHDDLARGLSLSYPWTGTISTQRAPRRSIWRSCLRPLTLKTVNST